MTSVVQKDKDETIQPMPDDKTKSQRALKQVLLCMTMILPLGCGRGLSTKVGRRYFNEM
jgi:hypothetical protein